MSRVSRSAVSAGISSAKLLIMSASGASMIRDQCMNTPCGGSSRQMVMSNQFCPAMSSRTWTSCIASSESKNVPSCKTARARAQDMSAPSANASTIRSHVRLLPPRANSIRS